LLPAQEGIETLEAELAAAQTETNSLRGRVAETRTELVTLEREHRTRVERQKAIALENERNLARITSAQEQIAALQERAAGAQAELTRRAEFRRWVEQNGKNPMPERPAAGRDPRAAADPLAAADTAHRQAAQDLRAAQTAVADERERRARSEAHLENARQRRAEEARKIRDTLATTPEDSLALAGLAPAAPLPAPHPAPP